MPGRVDCFSCFWLSLVPSLHCQFLEGRAVPPCVPGTQHGACQEAMLPDCGVKHCLLKASPHFNTILAAAPTLGEGLSPGPLTGPITRAAADQELARTFTALASGRAEARRPKPGGQPGRPEGPLVLTLGVHRRGAQWPCLKRAVLVQLPAVASGFGHSWMWHWDSVLLARLPFGQQPPGHPLRLSVAPGSPLTALSLEELGSRPQSFLVSPPA